MSGRNRLGAQIRAWKVAAAIGTAVVIGGPAWAQDLKVPADPVAKAAFEVLDKHCARCHQVGKLTARERPSKDFGNVLQLDELAESPSLVLPGNPFGSNLLKQIVNKEMPYDVIYEGAAGPLITENDVKVLEKWINSLGGSRAIAIEAAPAPAPGPAPAPVAEGPPPAAPGAPPPVAEGPPPAAPGAPPPAVVEGPPPAPGAPPAPAAEGPPPGPPPGGPGPGPGPVPVKVAGCDPGKAIGRKEMIGLMAADLEALPKPRAKGTRYLTLTHLFNTCKSEKYYDVYRHATIKLLNSLSRSSEVVVFEPIDPAGSIMRINIDDLGWDAKDWETLVAGYPYATLPDISINTITEQLSGTKTVFARADWFAFTASRPGMYEKLLKIPNTLKELAKEQGVDIDGNIKSFKAKRAGFAKSGVSVHNRLIERHPSKFGYFWTSYDFGGTKRKQNLFEFPLGPGGAKGFEHDGGETIWSLPNGFQAYFLNDKAGKTIPKGPTEVVKDTAGRDPAVTNGISCMRCHEFGMRKAKDDIRPQLLKGRVLSKEDRDSVEALYPEAKEMDVLIQSDGDRFMGAMARAKINPKLQGPGGMEMIFALSRAYEEEITVDQAAAELGIKKDELLNADVDKEFRTLLRRLSQGSVSREEFEAEYIKLSEGILDEKPIKGGARPAAVAAKGGADLILTSDKDSYKVGEQPVFTVQAPKDCFLTVTNVDDKGVGIVLFPNEFVKDNKIKAKVEIALGGAKLGFRYVMKDPGTETVTAVCTEAKVEVDGVKQVTSKAKPLVEVPNYTRSVAKGLETAPKKRAIEVLSPASADGVKDGKQKIPDPKAPASFRTAIKVDVKDK